MTLRRRHTGGGALPLAPLIDVVFQVLLFSMLTSGVAVNPALRVDLPEAYSTTPAEPGEIVVTVADTGDVSVGERKVDEDALVQALREESARTGSTTVLLLGDARIPYQTLVTVMDRIRLAGLESVSLGTRKAPLPP